MLQVKTSVRQSAIHGKGVFADERIAAGTVVWKFVHGEDTAYTKEEIERLSEPKRSEILSLFHPYISKQTGRYITFGDHAGFLNHSDTPNLGTRYEDGVEEDINFALRDIQLGEELTVDYRTFADEEMEFL